jgi:perosamine synthetase
MTPVPHSRPYLDTESASALAAVLGTYMIGEGTLAGAFQQRMSSWVGASGGIAVGSGTAALSLALRALDIGPGDGVVFPSYSCRSLLLAINSVGAVAQPCDVGANWLLEADQVGTVIDSRTKAIIVPHLYGFWADITAFQRFGLPIIEDFAQAIGADKERSLIGAIGAFSFHPTKCITTGEGGMCVTSNSSLLKRLSNIRNGTLNTGAIFAPLSDLSSALGLSQLSQYPRFLARRRAIVNSYKNALGQHVTRLAPWLNRDNWIGFRFPIRISGGLSAVAGAFAEQGIIVRRGVDELIHRDLERADYQFPNSVRHFNETVSLPLHPSLSDEEVTRCINAARSILRGSI